MEREGEEEEEEVEGGVMVQPRASTERTVSWAESLDGGRWWRRECEAEREVGESV